MEKCDKCGQALELHTLDDKLVRLVCACEQAKKCYKKTCGAAVTQAELVTGAPTIVKSYRCDEHGFEELRPTPVVTEEVSDGIPSVDVSDHSDVPHVSPVIEVPADVLLPSDVLAPVIVDSPVAAIEPVTEPPVPIAVAPLTQTIAENCFAVVELEAVGAALTEGVIDTCYKLISRSVPPMTQVTCVKCSDSHTLRSRTPVVVVDEKTNIGLHRTICPNCDESSLFVIAPARLAC